MQAAEKVRVGCVDIGDFIQIDQDGYAIGYGADYLNKIAEYTGWGILSISSALGGVAWICCAEGNWIYCSC